MNRSVGEFLRGNMWPRPHSTVEPGMGHELPGSVPYRWGEELEL